MAWSGSAGSKTFARLTGLFTGSTAWGQTEGAGRGITSADHDTHDQDLADGINTALTKDGSNKPTTDIDWGGFKITTLGAPTSGGDAANKTYVDAAVVATVNFTVRAATTANITISTALNNADSLDGLSLATNDRVLVKNQTATEENGIYVVGVAPARATDMDTWAETLGAIVNVTAGTAGANTSWRSTANSGGTIGVTSLVFSQFGTSLPTPVPVASGGTGTTTAAAAFSAIKQDATTAATGVVEALTAAEILTGTDTTRYPPIKTIYDAYAETALSDGATVAVDMATGINFSLTIAGNRTLGNPSNTKNGQSGRIRITQDGTGSRTLAYAANWEFANGAAVTLSTTAAAQDILYYDVISATRILITGIVKAIS